jgi:hypothetical protein
MDWQARSKNETYLSLRVGGYGDWVGCVLLETVVAVAVMGEARKRKLANDKTFKGEDYKLMQWRNVVRYLNYLREKKLRGIR